MLVKPLFWLVGFCFALRVCLPLPFLTVSPEGTPASFLVNIDLPRLFFPNSNIPSPILEAVLRKLNGFL